MNAALFAFLMTESFNFIMPLLILRVCLLRVFFVGVEPPLGTVWVLCT